MPYFIMVNKESKYFIKRTYQKSAVWRTYVSGHLKFSFDKTAPEPIIIQLTFRICTCN